MSDTIDIILGSPQLNQFLVSLCASFGAEVAKDIGKSIFASLKNRFERNKNIDKTKIDELGKKLLSFPEKKDISKLTQAFYLDFVTFMFQERDVKADKLSDEDCNYIATRTCAAFELESILLDMGYDISRIKYMAHLNGRKSRIPYSFDLMASYPQEYFDNVLITRIIDSRVCIPTEFINSIPMLIQDINGNTSESPSILRDHDIFFLIQTGKLENIGKIRQTIRIVQESFDVFLPRIIYLTEEDLERLMNIERAKAAESLSSRIKENQPYRGF